MENEDDCITDEDADFWNAYAADQERIEGRGQNSGCLTTVIILLLIGISGLFLLIGLI